MISSYRSTAHEPTQVELAMCPCVFMIVLIVCTPDISGPGA